MLTSMKSLMEAQHRDHEGIDRYWGLGAVVVLSSFLSTFVLANLAFFYVRIKETYDVDYETAMWPLTVLWISYRGAGAGMGAVLTSFSICTVTYFRKYRTTIDSLKYVGSTAAGVLGPVSLAFMVQGYGLNRALILLGVLVMNISPLTVLLKAPEAAGCECFHKLLHLKSRRLTITSRLLDGKIPLEYSEPTYSESFQGINQPFDAGYSTFTSMQLSIRRVQPSEELHEDLHCSLDQRLERNESKPASEIVSSNVTAPEDCSERPVAQAPQRGSNKHLLENSVSVFKLWKFYALALIYAVVDYTNFAFKTTMVAYAIDKGISQANSEYLIIYDAIGSLIGQLVLTRLLSYVHLRQGTAYALGLVTLSASLVALSFLSSQTAVIYIVIAASLPWGILRAIKQDMAAHFLGTDMSGAAWFITGTYVLPFILTCPVLTGELFTPFFTVAEEKLTQLIMNMDKTLIFA
ncbi:hypothetical protein HPB51_018594 [Rhipicephalus microplus]|uniref:Monocarboxylate transporter n=1 Tax=Rhipicephalus microplus TaxID=6941 RepID=A0A9J6E3Y3_RHIMP|nr:hypothetical protein HPB51_018594 [Rhipicephalus microplus]